MRTRTVAVEVGEAAAFVDLMRSIADLRLRAPIRTTDGVRSPLRPTISAVERFVKDRQTMASRLSVTARDDGAIVVSIAAGAQEGQGAADVVMDRDGRPTIMREGHPVEIHATVANARFRKALDAAVSPRGSRYGRIKRVEIDGIVFHSPQEGKRYLILKTDVAMGVIADLRLQVPFRFEEGGRLCFTYIADFTYTIVATGERIVEDVKGMPTEVYRLKKKLVEARHGIRIDEWPIPKKELERREREERRRAAAEEKERRRAEREAARAARAAAPAQPRRRRAAAVAAATIIQ